VARADWADGGRCGGIEQCRNATELWFDSTCQGGPLSRARLEGGVERLSVTNFAAPQTLIAEILHV